MYILFLSYILFLVLIIYILYLQYIDSSKQEIIDPSILDNILDRLFSNNLMNEDIKNTTDIPCNCKDKCNCRDRYKDTCNCKDKCNCRDRYKDTCNCKDKCNCRDRYKDTCNCKDKCNCRDRYKDTCNCKDKCNCRDRYKDTCNCKDKCNCRDRYKDTCNCRDRCKDRYKDTCNCRDRCKDRYNANCLHYYPRCYDEKVSHDICKDTLKSDIMMKQKCVYYILQEFLPKIYSVLFKYKNQYINTSVIHSCEKKISKVLLFVESNRFIEKCIDIQYNTNDKSNYTYLKRKEKYISSYIKKKIKHRNYIINVSFIDMIKHVCKLKYQLFLTICLANIVCSVSITDVCGKIYVFMCEVKQKSSSIVIYIPTFFLLGICKTYKINITITGTLVNNVLNSDDYIAQDCEICGM